MKIGILTFHKAINYGAYLQSYSLCSALNKIDSVDAEIIDYVPPKEAVKVIINLLWMFKHYGINGGIKEYKKIRAFKKAEKDQVLSNMHFLTNNMEKLFRYIDKNYDLLIIGSDAVFNWDQNGFPSAFIPNYKFSIPIVSYAASVHGLRYFEEEEEKIDVCKKCFQQMKYIGVRDKCTEKFVNYCNDNCIIHHNCDPTLFIDTKEISGKVDLEAVYKRYSFNNDKPYIILMLQNRELSKAIYDKYHGEYFVVSLFKPNEYSDAYWNDLTPFEWAVIISKAKCVITNYFHGTLLSFVQNVPAVVIDTSKYFGEYEGKLFDLVVNRLELENLYFNIEDDEKCKAENIINTIKLAITGSFNGDIRKGISKEKLCSVEFFEKIKNNFEMEI